LHGADLAYEEVVGFPSLIFLDLTVGPYVLLWCNLPGFLNRGKFTT